MNLLDYRKKHGLSYGDLAQRLGLTSRGHVSDIEKGFTRASLSLAMKIEHVTGGEVTAADLHAIPPQSRKVAA